MRDKRRKVQARDKRETKKMKVCFKTSIFFGITQPPGISCHFCVLTRPFFLFREYLLFVARVNLWQDAFRQIYCYVYYSTICSFQMVSWNISPNIFSSLLGNSVILHSVFISKHFTLPGGNGSLPFIAIKCLFKP